MDWSYMYLYFIIPNKTKKVERSKIQTLFVIYFQCMSWFPDREVTE